MILETTTVSVTIMNNPQKHKCAFFSFFPLVSIAAVLIHIVFLVSL